MIVINKEIVGANKRSKDPIAPPGYIRVTTDKIRATDKFWNWNESKFDDAYWLAGHSIVSSEQYIIRKAPAPPKPKRTWSRKLAALVVKGE